MSSRPDIDYQKSRILVVDDERANLRLLEEMLAPEGFLLLTATSGQEALDIVARQPPDLILLDVMMPGMDGYQVAAAIKGDLTTKNVPIIMITALDDRKVKLLGLTAGAEDFLTKPVDRAELCVRVRNLLRLKAYGDYYDKYSQILELEVASRTAALVERTRQAAVLTEQAALLDLAQDAIVVRDMGNRILSWNRGAQQMYGWQCTAALGQDANALLQTEFSRPTEMIEAELLSSGQWEGEATHRRRDGSRFMAASRWALQRDAEGVPFRVLTITNDITARKQAESELLMLTERLSLATAVAQVGVWEWDLATHSLAWDATMFSIYGLAPVVSMAYERWSSAVHHEDRPAVEVGLRQTIEAKGQGSAEYRIVLADGTIRNVSAVQRVILDERGIVSRVIGVNMDVTERKASEHGLEQLRQDQMRFKDAFLSHVSHELRSPLTAIKQFTTILLEGVAGPLNTEQREYQQIVLKNIHQLQSMIDDLLEVTRFETGKLGVDPERVSVADAVTDALNTHRVTAQAKGVSLTFDVPPDLPSAHADPTRLRQLLIILLDNAVKFTADGGAVSIRAELQQDDPPLLLVEVSDTGCGISPERAGSIFERLYQVSEAAQGSRKGLGLGLYICKELVTRQGGHIWVTSQPQQGSTFSFTLPVFALNHLMAPLLRNDMWPAESVALIRVSFGLLDPWTSSDRQEEWSREIRSLLQRCLHPTLDVLLPKRSSGSQQERFFVTAFADDYRAAVLVKRIREQCERLSYLKQPRLTVEVSHSMLPSAPADVGASTEAIVTRMATRVEESMQSQLIAEAVHHE